MAADEIRYADVIRIRPIARLLKSTQVDWDFFQQQNRQWYWRRRITRNDIAESDERFDTFAACVTDAVKHGYQPGRLRGRHEKAGEDVA